MVLIKIEQGNKSSKDKIIRLYANGEIITLEDILKMLDVIFKSEDSNYPINEGYEGRAYFLKSHNRIGLRNSHKPNFKKL
jgi:hypothetical protein